MDFSTPGLSTPGFSTPGSAASDTADPIAIVGVGCKLPGGVDSLDDLTAVLQSGRSGISMIPSDRWDLDAFYDADPLAPGKTYCRHGGFVTDIGSFDAGFFGISDGEAARMDPQQRMVLETMWHALEDAGQSVAELEHSDTGVFLAMMNTNGYAQLKDHLEGAGGVTGYDAMADSMAIAAGRISHFLGLHGPCLSVDTACSGSMVATHLARQSILAGDCDSAIVVGVNAIVHPGVHLAFSKVGLMSRSGQCHAFDEAADGYVRGEGCVAIVLRRQSLAIERGDRILASLVGTAMNQDGHTPALTAPNGQMQEQVMRRALARLGVTPHEIRYVEAHGTGTPVGDPIEMSAITNVFGPDKTDDDPLYVGSVKTNFGHLESAAGALGLIKAALSLDRETIFPNRNFTRMNPSIRLVNQAVRVPTATVPWPRGQHPRLAGVNSFGYSGTNVHAVLREAPAVADRPATATPRPAQLVVISAKTAVALHDLADRWAGFCETTTSPLDEVAFTAATGRTPMRHRLAVVGHDTAQVANRIRAWQADRAPQGVAAGQPPAGRTPKVAFVFSGQGSQHPGMGRQLYDTEPAFRDAIDRCAALMDADLGMPLPELLFSSSADLLRDTRYAQPALFAIGYALAVQLRHWGVEPAMLIGHSIGEITAACVAGMLDLDSGVRFVLARGRMMSRLPPGGAMLAVEATPEQAAAWIAGHEHELALAAVNGPTSVVLSGRQAAVAALADRVRDEGRRATPLKVSHAFHSPLMDPMLEELGEVAASLRTAPPTVPVVSNVTGAVMGDAPDGAYWTSHARQPVRFHDGVRTALDHGCSVLVELGPHPALLPAIAAALDTTRTQFVPTLRRDGHDVAHLLEAMATLWVSGAPVRPDRVFAEPARRVQLPLYPFRRTRYWVGGRMEDVSKPGFPAVELPTPQLPAELHPILGRAGAGPGHAVFTSEMAATAPWADHRVLGATVFPSTGYLEMAVRGYAALHGEQWRPAMLRDIRFERPLLLEYDAAKDVRLRLERHSSNGSGEVTFTVSGTSPAGDVTYCRGVIGDGDQPTERIGLDDELARMSSTAAVGPFYGELRHGGLEYGFAFATVREVWHGEADSGEAIGRVRANPDGDGDSPHDFVWTTVLDGCLQLLGAALGTLAADTGGAYIPSSIQSVTLRAPLPPTVWGHVSVRTSGDGRAAVADLRVIDGDGLLVASLDGAEFRQKSSLAAASDGPSEASQSSRVDGPSTMSRDELLVQLRDLPSGEQVAAVIAWLTAEVTDTLGQAAEELDFQSVDPSTAFLEIGMDSLLVTELQRRIQEKLAFRFEPMQALDYQSIESLATFLLTDVLRDELADVSPPPRPVPSG